ncbi:MAG: efflux RND transporter periplasmic adaptor subunit [Prevotellaceae bacterium]|jgi:RND family efflux transporter MFP subunit|nr:efflux RND transporter periplasmic adaptor subunit [Prevotellaceae bacterium]
MRLLATCFITSFFIISCLSNKNTTDESGVSSVLPEELSEVRALRLDYTDFQHELIANGTVSANKAELRFQTQENIAAIYVKNGDKVHKGQKIAMLDVFKLQNELAQAVDSKERATLELQDVLIGQGYTLDDTAKIPRDVWQIAKIKSNYNQSENQYKLAGYNYRNAVLYAPFDGTVANLFTQTYNLPNTTEPFCTVIDNSRTADFKILENELPFVHLGDLIEVSPFAADGYVCEGRITEINPSVDKNGMVRVKAAIRNVEKNLYDGMNIKIRLQRSLGKRLVIPKTALVLRTNKKVVFTLTGGLARWVYVQTGLENVSGYEITEGLAVGDSIIYEGNINLAHEAPVKLKVDSSYD